MKTIEERVIAAIKSVTGIRDLDTDEITHLTETQNFQKEIGYKKFYDISLSSIDREELIMELEREFDVAIDDDTIEGSSSITDIVKHVKERLGE